MSDVVTTGRCCSNVGDPSPGRNVEERKPGSCSYVREGNLMCVVMAGGGKALVVMWGNPCL